MTKGSRPKDRPFRQRALGRLGSLIGTLAVLALSLGLVIGGARVIAQNAQPLAGQQGSAPLTVEVVTAAHASGYTVPRDFTGRLEPARRTAAAFDSGGEVVELRVDEGDPVRAGDVLARLDTRQLNAERDRLVATRDAVDARIELARLTAVRQSELAERNFSSQQRADETRLQLRELAARHAEIAAQIAALDVRLDQSLLRAPFGGRIGARMIDEGARVTPAQPVLEVLETGAVRVRVGLSPDVAASLAPGAAVDVTMNDTKVNLRLLSRQSEIDPITRTRSTLFSLDRPLPDGMAFGDLVSIAVPRRVETPGLWLPVTALMQGPRGLWTVLLVETGNDGRPVARREAVELLHADTERAFVRGGVQLGAEVVATGPHRLGDGQAVQPVPAKTNGQPVEG